MSGTLYIVSTPIGNLEDMTQRALRILKEVDLIACEDTRQTRKLLDHYQIKNQLTSFFEHNEIRKIPEVVAVLQSGKSVAVVSDSGTPTISDPAFKLVREARAQGVAVVPVPGANAAMAAISVSGLPTDSFIFEGFLPHKKGRQTAWKKLAEEDRTIVLYESPHRVLKTLTEIQEHLGERHVVIARELTKKFEEILQGSSSELKTHFEKHEPRGEFVILITGKKYFEKHFE
ncbi:16S rRNA (cytidine(1402)-2'-O)-methyltransferase [bacterium]|nr:MAG: 16S rRNA (cytidine(1402)-2'-O)-methyltransferase [bacterium]